MCLLSLNLIVNIDTVLVYFVYICPYFVYILSNLLIYIHRVDFIGLDVCALKFVVLHLHFMPSTIICFICYIVYIYTSVYPDCIQGLLQGPRHNDHLQIIEFYQILYLPGW